MKKLILLSLFTMALCSNIYSADAEEKNWIDQTLDGLGLGDNKFDDMEMVDFSILPGPFYGPETSFGAAVSAIGLYRLDRDDKVTQPSSVIINGFGSINGTYGVQVKNKTFLKQDKYRFYFDADFTAAPDYYYGIGYDLNNDDSNAQAFDRDGYQLRPSIFFRTLKNTFLGVGADFKNYDVSYVEERDNGTENHAEDFIEFPNRTRNIGPMLHFMHDSRDFILNAHTGFLFQVDYGIYSTSFGSGSSYQAFDIEYSDYKHFASTGSTIAWQGKLNLREGDLPWTEMGTIGGTKGLRGYFEGRYRDEQAYIVQLEYRKDLSWRHGVAAWTGVGSVAPKVSEFDRARTLWSVGAGYRFEVKERLNIRLDYGIGEGESGFYMNIGEAF